jgi:hypothetical protein
MEYTRLKKIIIFYCWLGQQYGVEKSQVAGDVKTTLLLRCRQVAEAIGKCGKLFPPLRHAHYTHTYIRHFPFRCLTTCCCCCCGFCNIARPCLAIEGAAIPNPLVLRQVTGPSRFPVLVMMPLSRKCGQCITKTLLRHQPTGHISRCEGVRGACRTYGILIHYASLPRGGELTPTRQDNSVPGQRLLEHICFKSLW